MSVCSKTENVRRCTCRGLTERVLKRCNSSGFETFFLNLCLSQMTSKIFHTRSYQNGAKHQRSYPYCNCLFGWYGFILLKSRSNCNESWFCWIASLFLMKRDAMIKEEDKENKERDLTFDILDITKFPSQPEEKWTEFSMNTHQLQMLRVHFGYFLPTFYVLLSLH